MHNSISGKTLISKLDFCLKVDEPRAVTKTRTGQGLDWSWTGAF